LIQANSSAHGLSNGAFKAGGKPSTRLPPGKLVEHFNNQSTLKPQA
jgi:hypothetical protein